MREEENVNVTNHESRDMRHVYIIGAKSIGLYGGFESFVLNLLKHHKDNRNIKYHISCKANGQGYMDLDELPGAKKVNENEFTYCNAHCFMIKIPECLGSAQAIYYDIAALKYVCNHIENNHIENPIVYILASRIGPFEKKYVNRIHNAGGLVYQNPDGACEIMGSTGEKPVKSRLHGDSVFYPNSNTEYHIKNICSGILKRFCYIQMLLRQSGRAFFCWAFSKPLLFDPEIA
jgi:hypothetical protein